MSFYKSMPFFFALNHYKWCNVNFSGEVRKTELHLLRANCRNCLVTLFLLLCLLKFVCEKQLVLGLC